MNAVIAVPADENLASFIGKRGSSNGITFYNRKLGEDTIVALFPSQEDEKIYALAEVLLLSSKVVISTATMDKRFGEALVAASALGRMTLLTDDSDASALLRDSGISNCRVVSRGELLDALHADSDPLDSDREAEVRVDLDRAFPVKGIGTVALGVVTRGTLRQHDKLYHTSGRQLIVRSIQSQDVDVVSAGRGTRVGVSLKDIGDDEIDKGDLLTAALVRRSRKISIEYRVGKAAAEEVTEGAQYGLAHGFSYSECVVTKVGAGELELELKAAVPAEAGDEVLLVRKKVPRIFASGRLKETLVYD
jgi:selenocysteine-specific translation elongation factor